MAENPPIQSSSGSEGAYDTYGGEVDRERPRRGRTASRHQTRYWRRVPAISVLPRERKQLPANFLLRSVLVVAIGLLALVAAARYFDWNDFEDRTLAARSISQSVQRQLTARQSEIEPLQSQINVLSLELESAETAYSLATRGETDWFTAMSGLFAISVTGIEFLSATVETNGDITLVGVATGRDAIASLPTQLSQLSGIVDLQGIQWDAAVSPPSFTAEFRVGR